LACEHNLWTRDYVLLEIRREIDLAHPSSGSATLNNVHPRVW